MGPPQVSRGKSNASGSQPTRAHGLVTTGIPALRLGQRVSSPRGRGVPPPRNARARKAPVPPRSCSQTPRQAGQRAHRSWGCRPGALSTWQVDPTSETWTQTRGLTPRQGWSPRARRRRAAARGRGRDRGSSMHHCALQAFSDSSIPPQRTKLLFSWPPRVPPPRAPQNCPELSHSAESHRTTASSTVGSSDTPPSPSGSLGRPSSAPAHRRDRCAAWRAGRAAPPRHAHPPSGRPRRRQLDPTLPSCGAWQTACHPAGPGCTHAACTGTARGKNVRRETNKTRSAPAGSPAAPVSVILHKDLRSGSENNRYGMHRSPSFALIVNCFPH